MKTFFSFFGNPVYNNRKSMGRIFTFVTFIALCVSWTVMLFTDRVLPEMLMNSIETTFQSMLVYEGYKKARTVVENKMNPAPATPGQGDPAGTQQEV